MTDSIKLTWFDTDDISEEEERTLRDQGLKRALNMSLNGYLSGEMTYVIQDTEYRGWWEWD